MDAPVASFAVFLASGRAHELILAWPARGGHGLPASCFVLPWVGTAIERRWPPPSTPRLVRWSFGFLVAALCAPLPFTPPSMECVIAPWLAR